MRAAPYEVPSSKTRSPTSVRVARNATPRRRSLRPRDDHKYREHTPDILEDDDDAPYTSDNDCYGSQSSRRRGARSLQPHAKLLHQIQRDTSLVNCPICASDFSRHADVIRHYMSIHHIKSDAEILNDTSNKRLHCLGCTKILSRKDSRERHEAVCPVYCAQQGIMPDVITMYGDSRKQRFVCDICLTQNYFNTLFPLQSTRPQIFLVPMCMWIIVLEKDLCAFASNHCIFSF